MTKIVNVRNITKFRRSTKAISPVIATLLMIAIAVVASLVVYAWVSGYIGFQTNKAANAIALPSFAVADDNRMVVYVQNVGQGSVEVGSVYINDELKDFETDDPVISEGSTIALLVDGSYVSTERYDIKVTTKDGTSMTATGKPGTGGTVQNPGTTTYSVNFVIGENGASITANGVELTASGSRTYNAGEEVSISAAAASGYHFTNWALDGSIVLESANDVNSNTATINGEGTITANFAQDTFSYSTTTTLNAIATPLTSGQTNVAFSGSVSSSGTAVPNSVPVVLQYSTSTSGPWTTVTTVNTAGGSGAFSGTFTAPTTAGTYYYRAYFAEYTSGTNTWQTSTSSQSTVTVTGTFGNTNTGSSSYSGSIENTIRGTRFTSPSTSVSVISISAYIHVTTSYNIKAAIYTSDGNLIGTTGTPEVTVTTSNDDTFITFTYAAGTRPTLQASTQYVLVVWTNNQGSWGNPQSAELYGSSSSGSGRSESETYGAAFPSSIGSWDDSFGATYSIYCTYQ